MKIDIGMTGRRVWLATILALSCLLTALAGSARAAGWSGTGAPPVLPAVTAADAAFHTNAPLSVPKLASLGQSGTYQIAQESAPVPPAHVVHPVAYSGYAELSVPTWTQTGGYISNWHDAGFTGQLKVDNLFPAVPVLDRVSPVVQITHTLGSSDPFFDNELQVGVHYRLSPSTNLVSYWDRFLGVSSGDRVFVGVRCNFQGGG